MIITTLKVFIATKYITHFFDTLYVTERLSSCKTSLFGLSTNMVAQSHNEQVLDKKMCFQVLLIAVTGMNGLMTCCFTTFSTVFQSYQDDECVIMKGCVQWNPVYN